MPDFFYEQQHTGLICGIDEAGRGPLAGPVVAGAAIIKTQDLNLWKDVTDSKKLTAKKRDQLFPFIEDYAYVGVGIASVEEIDDINILQATFLAMKRAVENLPIMPAYALVDGNKIPPGLPCDATAVVKGDGKSVSIAAASIIAKVTRDRMMQDLDAVYPVYGWQKNAGYGTVLHRQAMQEHGVTKHHRQSFAPVRVLCAS